MFVASPLAAQEDTGEPALVETLVVNAKTPGPAWWSVSKGEAKVWVLGLGAVVPASTPWDASAFERRVKVSRRVIYADLNGKMRFSKDVLQADRPWVEELTDAERARLAQVAAANGKPVEFYAKFRPNMAGMLIKSDIAAKAGSPKKSLDLVARAKAQRVTLIPIKGRIVQGIKQSFVKGDRDGLACVRWALSSRDEAVATQARAEAWARGDVRSLVTGPMAYDPCIQSLKAMQTSFEAHETALADTIATSLDKGENAVALVTLVALLR